MASLTLKNVKKIYPIGSENGKKKEKWWKKWLRRGEEPAEEEQVSQQITEEGIVAVRDLNLEVNDKEFIVLVGPSGCGKSTTLRMIAGLEEVTEGEIWIGDRMVNDVDPKDRDIAMVFQHYALYPHMSVYENMAFALKLRRMDNATIDEKVRQAAEILDLTPLLRRKPKALSGGQRQRVAIGRAIVRDPQIMLMDEPLSNLDAKLRSQMRAEIIKLRERINTTFVYVTHDQTEAMTLGDRIVVMKEGCIQQIGTPQEVFNHPSNLFVASFIGAPQMNTFDAILLKQDGRYAVALGGMVVELSEDKQEKLAANGVQAQAVTLGIRPEHITLDENGIDARVEVHELMGSSVHLHVNALGRQVVMVLSTMNMTGSQAASLSAGSHLRFSFPGSGCHVFSQETGVNLEA